MDNANDFRAVRGADSYLVGGVLAFREFNLYGEGASIGGLTYNQPVLPGRNVAQCPIHRDDSDHVAPVENCKCGWYAYDEHRHWSQPQGYPRLDRKGRFSAVVSLSGKLVVCERGVKAQHMKVVAVTAHPADEAAVRAILPDVKFYNTEVDMLASHPLTELDRGIIFTLVEALRQHMGVVSRVVTPRRLLPVLLALFLFPIASWGFPPGSISGYGPLIPALILTIVSALTMTLRSLKTYWSYLALWGYGVAASWETLVAGMEHVGLTQNALVVLVSLLPLAPALDARRKWAVESRDANWLSNSYATWSWPANSQAPPHQLTIGGAGVGLARASKHTQLPAKTLPTKTL